MNRFTDAIRKSVQAGNWFAGLFLALSMPDICGKLEEPNVKSGPRYKSWFNKYLAPRHAVAMSGDIESFMTAGDCWALRCSLLHEGSDDVSGQKAAETLSRFRFANIGSHKFKCKKDVLVLDVGSFCMEMCCAVEAWAADVSSCAEVQRRIAEIIKIEESGFSPCPGVYLADDAEFDELLSGSARNE